MCCPSQVVQTKWGALLGAIGSKPTAGSSPNSLRDQRGRHHLLAASVPDEEPVEFMIIATRRYTITYLDIIDGHICVAFALLFLHI